MVGVMVAVGVMVEVLVRIGVGVGSPGNNWDCGMTSCGTVGEDHFRIALAKPVTSRQSSRGFRHRGRSTSVGGSFGFEARIYPPRSGLSKWTIRTPAVPQF
jgi:hypothetical protein